MSTQKALIDLVFCLLIAVMTYALSSEGLWGAALMFFNVLFSGLIAFNFYEPFAAMIDNMGLGWGFSDTFSLLSTFCVSLVFFRLTTGSLAPTMVRFPTAIYHTGRWLFALATSLVTMSILILAFHTAPVHKKIFGAVDWKYRPPFGIGLDHQWLGFFQYTTGDIFARYGSGVRDPYREYGRSGADCVPVRVFDPRATWLLDHQEARPYGEGPILGEDDGTQAASAGDRSSRKGQGSGSPGS